MVRPAAESVCLMHQIANIFLKPIESKDELVHKMILHVMERFPDKKFIVLADGIFAKKEFFGWCIQNNIAAETRIHSNRKVVYQGEQIVIRNIAHLRPKERQRARTICVLWHGIMLYITADKRIDKHGTVTVVFYASSVKASAAARIFCAREKPLGCVGS